MNPDKLKDEITRLVFEWHQEVEKLPRGKTIIFWNDDKVMQAIEIEIARQVTEAYKKGREEALKELLVEHDQICGATFNEDPRDDCTLRQQIFSRLKSTTDSKGGK